MEGAADTHFTAYYHPSTASNGIFSATSPTPLPSSSSSEAAPPVPGHASNAPAPVSGSVKRKRGRPRKYASGGATGAKKPPVASAASSLPSSSSALPASPPSKKLQLDSFGNAGQGFTHHFIAVAAGEDVAQKIMSFIQQRKCAVCILSASGSISAASLRQPATSGGNMTYEGCFEILSLSGSYLHTEIEGASSRTGGLSVCLSGTDGRIVGGGVEGPLKAAGPVQVTAASFMIDMNKDTSSVRKSDTCGLAIGAMMLPVAFRSTPDSSKRNSANGNDDHHNNMGSGFMVQSQQWM
ncbi:hypothetical protein MRB53_007609 [Persea americana]|uniref:Uncharacterized protein n=1 Tax=Persea americana TaxID=3435 RepID=A0ACC2MKC7_PERAE|nr:hypothetical protein MRB53_007609 [Persea americana]|eukprot:TRINITY_DN15339_c0_g3_i1.p1 TRINITY_DN15339_c0_g3~~TRINITY_DN15339_c0_g3_i1.p1  ORF type:complete len:296 (+),score=63.18 TRINITY_DN15339_c0_g3_i1:1111-1998(+)